MTKSTPLRLVLDTNVLVGSAYQETSASRQIVEGCLQGKFIGLISPDLKAEYEYILPRAIHIRDFWQRLQIFLEQAECVVPEETPRVVPDDPEDDKLLALAKAGNADALITSDSHLISLGTHENIPIVKPQKFLENLADQSSSSAPISDHEK